MVKLYPDNYDDVLMTSKDILNSIAERDIYTGDNGEYIVIKKDGVKIERERLRRDWK